MVKKRSHILISFLLPLSLVVVLWLYEINFIAYADFSPPQSQMRPTRRYEEGRDMNNGTIEKVRFLQSTPKPVAAQLEMKAENNDEKKKDNLPAWMTILSAIGLLGASQALKKENPIPVAVKEEFEIMKVPRTIYANVTKMVDQTIEVVKSVPYTVYETAYKTVDKVIDVTREVAETVYETVKEKVIQPLTEVYDKAVTKTKQITEYVTKQFEEVSKVARTVFDKVEHTVEKVVPVVRQVTDYVTTKVEESYKYATQITKNVAEWVMTPMNEAYEVMREVPRQVTEYVTEKVKQTKEVARTVYDNVERSKVWFEEKVSTVWDEVRQLKTRVVEKYEDVRNWVGDTYRTITERVWGQTGQSVRYEDVPVYGMVAETTTNLVKNGWNWLKKGWNWVANTTTKWVSKVVGWTKKKIIDPVYGWVTRSYQQLAEAGHWVTDKVRRFVNETYTDIQRIPRTIVEKVRHVKEWIEKVPRTVYDTVTEWVEKIAPVVRTVYDKVKDTAYRMVEKPVQIVKQVAETVWNTATRLVDKVVPVVRQVTDYVTEKVKEIVEVPRTIYDTIVNVVERVVPFVKDVAYTAYEKAERIVDKVVEISKEVAKTVYRQVTEKVITPIVEAYEVAVEKFKDVKEYVTTKVEKTWQVARTVYDEVKVKKALVEAASPVTSFVANKVVLPLVNNTINSVVTGTGIVVGATENVIDTVSAFGSLAYNYFFHNKETKDALAEYGANSLTHPVDAGKDIVEGYVEDLTSRWGDGSSTFNQWRAVGYAGFDVATSIPTGGLLGMVKNVSKEVTEKVAKEVSEQIAQEVAEKAEKEVAEKVEKELTEKVTKEVTQEVTEKPIKEAVAQTTKEAVDQAKKEAIEKAEKEAILKAEKEAAEKAAKQKLIATTGKQASVAAEEMTQTAAAKAGVSTTKGATSSIIQPVKTLDGIYKLSDEAKIPFDKTLKDIAQQSGGIDKPAPLKRRARAVEKVEEYIGEGKGPESLKDVLRGTVSYDNLEQMSKGLEILSEKFKIVGIKNRVSVPETSGYRDIQIFVENENKVIGEIQLNVKEILDAKNYETDVLQLPEKTRALKQQLKDTSDLAKKAEINEQLNGLIRQAQEVYNPAWEKFLERTSLNLSQ